MTVSVAHCRRGIDAQAQRLRGLAHHLGGRRDARGASEKIHPGDAEDVAQLLDDIADKLDLLGRGLDDDESTAVKGLPRASALIYTLVQPDWDDSEAVTVTLGPKRDIDASHEGAE